MTDKQATLRLVGDERGRLPKFIREARLGFVMRQAENFLLVGDCLLRTLGLG
jgi:hypothetical protein